MRIKLLASALLLITLTGCDHVPHQQFKISTVNGEVLTLSCPVIDPMRSAITFVYDGDCVLLK